jgi:hypothetical protein
MYILVKTITDRQTLEAYEGQNLAQLSRACFLNRQTLTIDFDHIDTATEDFCQELFFPLINEFGADYLKECLKIEHISQDLDAIIKSAFSKLDGYFDRLQQISDRNFDREVFTLNYYWLIKAREHCRQNRVFAEFALGITDNELQIAIGRLTMEDIQQIAESGWLCFAPRFNSNFFQSKPDKPQTTIDVLLALTGSF